MRLLNCSCDRTAHWLYLISGVGCEGEGPEPVVMGALGVAVGYTARLGELVFLCVELVKEVPVIGYQELLPSHALPEDLGHLLLALDGENDALRVRHPGLPHVLDKVVPVLGAVDVGGMDPAPSFREELRIADH